ncbi:MAG: response regulator transcription factor [Chryseotalea sp. WA131a]|jgi:DNA-binding LytR/AlgR family response regulator|nr:MAG: response regulator transcription factor [Chryseotalea sp. WA131a]
MRAIVVEDEELAAERLIDLIKAIDPTIEIVAQPDTVADTLHFLKTQPVPDVIFLDIQLADGRSFEIFERASIDSPIIFITAYDQFTLKAFKVNSIDYLLKPVQKEDLRLALEKLKKLNRKGLNGDELDLLKEIIKSKGQSYKQRLVIKAGNKIQFKPAEEVAYFFADGKEAYMVSRKENRKHLIGYTLEELEEILDPRDFFRISRKFIVRADAIAEVKGLISSRLEVKLIQNTEHELAVSRERAQDFKTWLDQ